MSISKTEINKLKKAVKEFTGKHKFVFSQGQTIPTVSATAYDKQLRGLPATSDEEKDKFIEEFKKEPFSLSTIEEKQGKTTIRIILANSPEGKKLIKTDKVEMPNFILFGVEKAPVDENGKIMDL